MQIESKLNVGQIMGERYRITGLIGSGGMSHVYAAEDLRLKGKCWAVKESRGGQRLSADIQAEAELLISLDHPRLPRIADFYIPDEDGYSYLIMDYIDGVTLSEYMEANPGPLPAELIIRCARQLLEVLQYLHGHRPPIIYRDLKPSNIMLTVQMEWMLIDFGIARSYKAGNGQDTEKLGTVGFAAPEQYGGQSQPATDLYGLGALLLYMATGGQCSRWEPGMEAKLHGRIPAVLIPVLRRLLRQYPEERFPTAEAVLQALLPAEAEAEAEAEVEAESGKSAAACSRESVPRRGICVVAVLGVAAGLGTTHTSFAVSSLLSHIGPTAWVDMCPDSPVHARIGSLLEVPKQAGTDRDGVSSFVWKGVHYWNCPANREITGFLDGTYPFVVLDLGTGESAGAMEEFAHSDVPLLIASGADWRLEETLVWLRRSGLRPGPRWRIGLPLADSAAVQLLQSAIGAGSVYGLPLQRDPFNHKGKLEERLRELLSEQIQVRNPGTGRRFFQKKR